MEKFSFKDVLILFAGTIITIGIAWVLLTVTGFVPREIGKLFFEGAVVGQRNILNGQNANKFDWMSPIKKSSQNS